MNKFCKFLRIALPSFLFKDENISKKEYQHINDVASWTKMEVDILNQINIQIRTEAPALIPDQNLRTGCAERCEYMDSIDNISHDNIEDVRNALHKLGLYPVTECLEKNHRTAESIVKALKNSPKHYNELKNKRYIYIGIRRIQDEEQYYTVILIASPGENS